MEASKNSGWLALCREQRIDPDEVRIVFSRYDAYRRYADNGRDSSIDLDQWFKFYRMEKASEGEQAGPPPSGCSIDSDAVNNACIKRPGPFLMVLKAFLTADESG